MQKKIDTISIRLKVAAAIHGLDNSVASVCKEVFAFKGRKSPELMQRVMEALVEGEGIIADPFLGTGMSLIAAVKAGHSFVGCELDNYTYAVDKVLYEKMDKKAVDKAFAVVEAGVKERIMALYETQCCGHKNHIKKVLFDPQEGREGYFHPSPNREIVNGCSVKLVKRCPICGKTSKQFEELDWLKLEEVEQLDASGFPADEYLANSRINITESTGAHKYGAIFTHRNKIALLMIQDELSKLPASQEKDFLQHALVAALSLARIAMYGSSTDILYHVVNEKAQDMNVWELFASRYKKFIEFQKENAVVLCDNFGGNKRYENNKRYGVANADYYQFFKQRPDLKVDAIVTDFPYTDQVPYLERSQMFRVWLNHFAHDKGKFPLTDGMLESEMVVTNALARPTKNLNNYYKDLDKMFETFAEHLPVGGPVVIFTKLGKMKYFNVFAHVIDYARKNGFEYTFRMGIEKNDPTLRKQSAYKNTLLNEVIIGFEKLPEDKRYLYIGDENYENKLVDMVYRELKKVKDAPYTLTAAVSRAKKDLERKGVPFDEAMAKRLDKVVRNNFYVLDNQAIQLDKTRLYLDQEDEDTLFKKLYEMVPLYVNALLAEKEKFVLEDLYVELIDRLSDGNSQTLYSLLEDDDNIKEIDALVADKTDKSPDGKYYIKKKLPKEFNATAKDIATMDPYGFEDVCKRLLVAENYVDVHRKGGSGDLGVDIVAKWFNGNSGESWLIQCKRWVSNVDAVPLQRLVAERERLGANKIACYTTSGYSRDAKKIAQLQNVELVDGKELVMRLSKHFPGEYYNSNLQSVKS